MIVAICLLGKVKRNYVQDVVCILLVKQISYVKGAEVWYNNKKTSNLIFSSMQFLISKAKVSIFFHELTSYGFLGTYQQYRLVKPNIFSSNIYLVTFIKDEYVVSCQTHMKILNGIQYLFIYSTVFTFIHVLGERCCQRDVFSFLFSSRFSQQSQKAKLLVQ